MENNNEIVVEFQDDFTLTFITYHKILQHGGPKDGPIALSLYIRYIEQVKRQGKNQTWSLDKFMIKSSGLEKRKFYKIKKILTDLHLIEQMKGQGKDVKVKVNFVIYKTKPDDNLVGAKNAPCEVSVGAKNDSFQLVHFLLGAENAPLNNKEEDNIYINKDKDNNNILSKDNTKVETFEGISPLGKFNENNKTEETEETEETEKIEETNEEKPTNENSAVGEKVTYGNEDINKILLFLKQTVGIDDFKESSRLQRMYGKHMLNLGKKIGKDEYLSRVKSILEDGFKLKNSNSIAYLYKEIKSFIHSPLVNLKPKQKVTYG